MNSQPTYLPDDVYHDILDKLETINDTVNPPELRTRLIMILGEIGNVWPCSSFTGDGNS